MHTPKPHTTDEIREDSILSNFLHSMQEKTESTLTADSIDNHISYTPSEDGKWFMIVFDGISVGYIDYTKHDDENHPNGKFISIDLFGTSNVYEKPNGAQDLQDYRPLRALPVNGKIDYLGHVLIASFIRSHASGYSKIFLDAVGTKEYWRDSVGKFLLSQGLISKSHSQGMEVVYTLPTGVKHDSIDLEQKLARYGITPPKSITNV